MVRVDPVALLGAKLGDIHELGLDGHVRQRRHRHVRLARKPAPRCNFPHMFLQ
jgi:hypothetical protein